MNEAAPQAAVSISGEDIANAYLSRSVNAFCLAAGQPGAEMQSTDYTKLADPDLFEERRHVREKLECLPPHHADRARLEQQFDAMTEEFDRRARSAWQTS